MALSIIAEQFGLLHVETPIRKGVFCFYESAWVVPLCSVSSMGWKASIYGRLVCYCEHLPFHRRNWDVDRVNIYLFIDELVF